MAIDTAAKRRNVSRMMQVSAMIGLSPSSGLDTADRVNAARAYIGIDYQDEAPPEPEPESNGSGSRRKMGIGPR
jgi:hypothetical protein